MNKHRSTGATQAARQFFTDNPDEELLFSDFQSKFGATKSNVISIIKVLRREGLIESVHVVRATPTVRAAAKMPEPLWPVQPPRQHDSTGLITLEGL